MKILAVLTCDPFSSEYGGTYAVRGTLAGLSKLGDLYVTGYGPSFSCCSLGGYRSCGSIGTVENSIVRFLASICRSNAYSLEKYSGIGSRHKFCDLLSSQNFDVIWYEHVHSAAVAYFSGIMRHRQQKLRHIVRMHNLEWQVVANRPGTVAKLGRSLLKVEARNLRKYEIEIARSADHIFTISTEDQRMLVRECPDVENKVAVLPPTVKLFASSHRTSETRSTVLFVGNCSWGPNLSSACWIIDCLGPALHRCMPHLTLRIVGKNTERLSSRARTDNVQCVGFVQDIASEYSKAICTLAPVWTGGGVNIKVLDSLGNGVPVVGSRFARRGMDSEAFLTAETPSEFIEAVSRLQNDSFARSLSSSAVASIVEVNRRAEAVLNDVINACQAARRVGSCV